MKSQLSSNMDDDYSPSHPLRYVETHCFRGLEQDQEQQRFYSSRHTLKYDTNGFPVEGTSQLERSLEMAAAEGKIYGSFGSHHIFEELIHPTPEKQGEESIGNDRIIDSNNDLGSFSKPFSNTHIIKGSSSKMKSKKRKPQIRAKTG